MRFDIKNYAGKYCMHCVTEEEAKSFCDYLHSIGRTWIGGGKYTTNTCWNAYREDMVYCFNSGTYADVEYYKNLGYTILEWSDYMNKEFTKDDLRNGDVVLFKNKTVGIYNETLNMFISIDGYVSMLNFKNNLTCRSNEYDIVAVRRPRQPHHCVFNAFDKERGDLVYECKEVEEMTLEQVCKLLGKEIKIVKGK